MEKEIIEITLKHPTEEKWFKSLEVDDNHRIIKWEWTEYYESADIFPEDVELINKIVNRLNIEYILDKEIIVIGDDGYPLEVNKLNLLKGDE